MSSKTPITFETALNELETIVERLESGELSLNDALTTYEKGVKLSKQCQQLLDKAELKIQKLAPNATDSTP